MGFKAKAVAVSLQSWEKSAKMEATEEQNSEEKASKRNDGFKDTTESLNPSAPEANHTSGRTCK